MGGLNIAEVRKAQQYKPIVPGKYSKPLCLLSLQLFTVQIKQKVEWFQLHVEDINTLRSQLEGNLLMSSELQLHTIIMTSSVIQTGLSK